ncbi:hypothetical protein LGVB_00095 [Lactobacillus gasseri]|nr:hypothetical protein [Lactobacillus gasseri]
MVVSNERKKQRILHHASSVASTMKNGQRKFIPRQKVNGGKVMIEKASGDKFKVYMASDKRFQGMRGKQQYAIEVYDGSKKGISNSGGVYRQGSDMFKKYGLSFLLINQVESLLKRDQQGAEEVSYV